MTYKLTISREDGTVIEHVDVEAHLPLADGYNFSAAERAIALDLAFRIRPRAVLHAHNLPNPRRFRWISLPR